MIQLCKFEATHWLLLTRDTSRKSVLLGRIREESGVAYSAIEDGMILGSAGIIAENRCGAPWALLTDELKQRHPLWFHRTARQLLMPVIQAMDLLRLDATVDPNINMNCRWITKLGFKFNRVKEKAGAGGADVWEFTFFPQRDAP